MSANQGLEVTGSRALVPSQFKLQFGSIGPRGYEFTEGIDVTPDQVVEEAKRIAGGLRAIDGTRQFIIGSFVRNSERKIGEMASQVYDIFGMKKGRLGQVLQVIDNVPSELWNPSIPFEIHYEVAHLPKNEDKAALLSLAAERKLTVAEVKVAKKAYQAAMAKPTTGEAPSPPEKQSPFHFSFSFRAPEAKESLKDFAAAVLKEIIAAVTEAVRCYMQPKYAAAKAEKERSDKFKALMTDVPKADQPQFQTMFEESVPVSAIGRSVKTYQAAKSDADALDQLLNTVVDPVVRAEFQTQADSGVAIKTVKVAVEAHNKQAINVKAVNDALDEAKITDVEKRQGFVAQLSVAPAVKLSAIKSAIKKAGKVVASEATNLKAVNDALNAAKITDLAAREKFMVRLGTNKLGVIKAEIKQAGKDAMTETTRAEGIKTLLNEIPEEQRSKFLETANVNGPVKDFKQKVTAWQSTISAEQKSAVDKRREARKTERANAASMLKLVNQKQEASNKLREAGQIALADAEDVQIADLQAKADEIVSRTDQEEIDDRLLLGLPAHPKPSQKANGKTKGKKAMKRAKKKSGGR